EKGIVGRGILLDWAAWMESKNASFDVFNACSLILFMLSVLTFRQATTITTAELDEVALSQGLDPASFAKPGDFLVVRTGFTQQYLALSPHAQAIVPFREGGNATFLGLEASDATLRWVWDRKFSMVGGDHPAFEALGAPLGTIDGIQRSLHEIFLGGWGLNIG
ncbi:hypothetical protein K438DRAFT_1591726, partial [Mycena galopus ATCC 62051]